MGKVWQENILRSFLELPRLSCLNLWEGPEKNEPSHPSRQPGYLFRDPWLSVPTLRWVWFYSQD